MAVARRELARAPSGSPLGLRQVSLCVSLSYSRCVSLPCFSSRLNATHCARNSVASASSQLTRAAAGRGCSSARARRLSSIETNCVGQMPVLQAIVNVEPRRAAWKRSWPDGRARIQSIGMQALSACVRHRTSAGTDASVSAALPPDIRRVAVVIGAWLLGEARSSVSAARRGLSCAAAARQRRRTAGVDGAEWRSARPPARASEPVMDDAPRFAAIPRT